MRAIGGIVLALAAAWGLHVYGAGRIDGLLAVFLTALAGWAAGWLTGSLRPGRPPAPPAPKCPDMENQLLTLLKSPGANAEVAQAGEALLSALLRHARSENAAGEALDGKNRQG